jgi:hypothetical protein
MWSIGEQQLWHAQLVLLSSVAVQTAGVGQPTEEQKFAHVKWFTEKGKPAAEEGIPCSSLAVPG